MKREPVQPAADRDSSETVVPKKRRGVLWMVKWSTIAILLILIVLVCLNFRIPPGNSSPLVRVSPQTTFAVSPLKPSGDIDYIAFLNQQHAVTPEDNAFVDLLRIKGPVAEKRMPPPEFFRLLGIEPPPPIGDYYVEFPLPAQLALGPGATIDGTKLDAAEIFEITSSVPFSPGQFPAVDNWFARNEHHLAAIHQAVRKPGYYMPYVGDTVAGIGHPHTQEMRGIARGLQRASMLRLGRGDVAGAIDDQLAMLRLGRHVGRNGTPTEYLIGLAAERMGQYSLAQTIFSGKCSAADLARLANELKSLPPPLDYSTGNLRTLRVQALDVIIQIGRQGPFPWKDDMPTLFTVDPVPNSTISDKLVRSTINWELVFITLNNEFDRIEATLLDKSMSKAEMVRMYVADQRALEIGQGTSTEMIGTALASRNGRSRLVGNIAAALIAPGLGHIQDINGLDAVIQVAIALQRFHLDHGAYPERLDQLVPAYLEAIPLDPCTDQPLVYTPKQGDPFLLYSLGANRIDDGGISIFENQSSQVDLPAAPKIRTVAEWIKAKK